MRTALFLDGSQGPLFAYLRTPDGPIRGRVLLVPPFAEELNKSRRMLALVADALAAAGFTSILVDLYGTGDSAGDFGDARWSTWLADLDTACRRLGEQDDLPLGVLAVRTGALLARDWLATRPRPAQTLALWQPVCAGELFLTQFLRLRSMAAKLAGREEPVKALRAQLDAGTALEIAGYGLAPALAQALAERRLTAPVPAATTIRAWEIGSGETTPALASVVADWQDAGGDVVAAVVPGEPFWSTQEIAECPALIAATVAAFEEMR